jgi:hypothetical protein
MKSQAAVEYFTIISIALLLLLPLSLYVNELLTGYRDDTRLSLAKDLVKKLGENVDWVYSQGPPARVSLKVYVPEGVEEASLENKTILLRMRTSAGLSDVYYMAVPELNGSLPSESGYYSVSLVAYENYVNISVIE